MSFNFGGNAAAGGEKKSFGFGNTSTPAPSAPTNLFGNLATTTPAGPPPSNTGFSFGASAGNNSTGGLFGAAKNNENKSMFGSTVATGAGNPPASFSFGGAQSTGSTTPAQTPAPSTSSKTFTFGGNAAQTQPQPAATPGGGFSFASTGTSDSKGLAQNSANQASTGFSFGGAKSTTGTSGTPAVAPSSFSFGAPVASEQAQGTEKTPATSGGGFSFGTTEKTKEPSANPTSASGGFSFGTATKDIGADTNNSKPATKSLSFGTSATSEPKADASKASSGFGFEASKTAEAKAPANTAPAATFGFGAAKVDDKKDPAPQTSTGFGFKPTSSPNDSSTDKFNTGTASAPVAAPAAASLKNKTMEDIINRWSADLDKYSQEFQTQARQVALWDQSLLSSGDQISRLYSATVEAEQHSGKVDQALNYIENQQDELSQLLDSYEAQVRDISTEVGVTQPADQEREKAYNQAEKLVGELNNMGKNLGQMITEVNKSSEVMSRLKEDDPLSSIVKILNSQVQSLNWIDENATRVNEKIEQLSAMRDNETPRTPTNKFRFGSLRLE